MNKLKCRQCKEYSRPENGIKVPLGYFCSSQCAAEYGMSRHQKATEKKRRKEHREAKERIKTRSQWLREAQSAYNKVIRLLYKEDPCISCGRYDWEIKEYLRGGKWDCGHYKTRGAHPELRFILINTWKQCKSCNGGSGKYTKKNHTVGRDYRDNLIEKIGLEDVEWLDGPQPERTYSIDELKEIKQGFTQWARELEKDKTIS